MKKLVKNRSEIKKKIKSMSEEELVDLFMYNEEELIQKNEELRKNNEELQQLTEKMKWLEEQLILLKKLRFSSKSEKVIAGQLNLFNEVEDLADQIPATFDEESEEKKTGKKKKTKEARFSKLPVKIVDHVLEETHCAICGTPMKELAPQIVDVLKCRPAQFWIERHILHQYLCPSCTEENLQAEIVSAPGAPKRLIPGSLVSPSVVAQIVFKKYGEGVPLYRQEQELKRQKIEISRATMSNWLMRCGKLLEPLEKIMHERLRQQSHIHLDETTVVVLEDKRQEGREKSYMWLAASGKYEEEPIAIYRYHPNREHAFAQEMAGEEYRGGAHCDGYEAYHGLKKATIYGCMAHARRYFVEAMEVSPHYEASKHMNQAQLQEYCEKNPSYGNLMVVLDQFKRLFAYEKQYEKEGLSPERIEKRRQAEQKPILDELFQRLEKMQGEYTTKSKMGKAIAYTLNQWKYLVHYLQDGKAEITNNRAERLIKSFVMGRKAWLFSNAKQGAEISAIYYSLIESAKLNHLNVVQYLDYVLTEIQNNPDNPNYHALLPYSKDLPDSIRVKE